LKEQGFTGENIYILGHSLGGVMSQIYLSSESKYKGLILMGSAILRKYRNIKSDGKS